MNGLGTIYILWIAIGLSTANTSKDTKLSNVVAIVGRHFTYPLPEDSYSKSANYMVKEEGKKSLPKWLSFDREKNLLYGVPSWRDKGTYHLQLHSTDTKPFILYVKDLHDVASDVKLRNSNITKVPAFKEIVCHSGLPVAAATIIFDLHAGKLSGKERAVLLKRVAAFADIDVSNLHMSLGKGHSTALNLKDVTMLTAGPGNVHEPKEPGVVVSWQIGCGIDVAGTRTASLLKSSAETGAFEKALSSPISGWHITTGFPKGPRRRTRRQVLINLQPTPTPSRKPSVPAGKLPLLTATPTMVVTPPTTQITKPTIVISSPTVVVIPTSAVNSRPRVIDLNPITLYTGQMLRFPIPQNTFFDPEDGNTKSLTLSMYSMSGSSISLSNWVLLDGSSQVIYGLGMSQNIGVHQFWVSAVDSQGASVRTPLTIKIQNDLHQYNHVFSLDLNMDLSVLSNKVELRVELLDLLATYFGVSSGDIRAVSISAGASGGSNFKFHFANVPYRPCPPNNPNLERLIDRFGRSSVSSNLVTALGSRFAMNGGSYKLLGDCSNKPTINKAIGQIDSVAGQAFEVSLPRDVFIDVEDGYNVDLQLLTEGLAELQPTSSILFHKSQRKIYGLPMDDMIRQHRYTLQATDSDNNIGMDTFTVNVADDNNRYNHEFNIVLNTDNVDFTTNVDNRLKLLNEIAAYFQTDIKNVRVVNFGTGVTFTFRFSDVPYKDCKGRLKTLIDMFGKKKDQINPNFKRALSFPITKGRYTLLGPCKVDTDPPRCDKPFSSIPAVYAGQQFEFVIPRDTCIDQVDGNMFDLNLELRALGDIVLPSNSWVLLDGKSLKIFGLPTDMQQGDNEFVLIVKDSSGLSARDTFKIPVNKDTFPYNHVFNIVLDIDKTKFMDNVDMRIDLIKTLASYFGVDPDDIRVSSIKDGSGPKDVEFSFHIAGIPEKQCDSKELVSAVNAFGKDSLTAPFLSALRPKYVVKSGNYKLLRVCASNKKPEVKEGIVDDDKPIQTVGGQVTYYTIPVDAFIDPEDGDTRKLKLRLLEPDGSAVPAGSWIRFDTDKQEIQALPLGAQAGRNRFIIEAIDSKGGTVNSSFVIQVGDDLRNYTHQLTLLLDYPDEKTFLNDVKERLELVDVLANYFNVPKEYVRVIFAKKGVQFSFYLHNIPDGVCNSQVRFDAINKFGRAGKVSRSLKKALEPRFKVKRAYTDVLGVCRPLGNQPPILNVPLGTLNVEAGSPLIFKIPYDTFLDMNEINTRYLSLELKTEDELPLPQKSFVKLLKKPKQELVILPSKDDIGKHRFTLMAYDKARTTATDRFKIKVSKPSKKPTTAFTLYLKTPKNAFMNGVDAPMNLIQEIADFFKIPYWQVMALGWGPDGSTIKFRFGLKNLPEQPCDHEETVKYANKFGRNKPSKQLKNAISYTIRSAKVEQFGVCKPKPFNNKPIVRNEFDRLNLFHNQALRFVIPWDSYDDIEDGTTRNLALTLRLEGHKEKALLSTSWILMNSTSQEIYALPMPEFIGLHTFVIEVKDSGGKMNYDSFEVLIKEDSAPSNHKFTIFLDNDNATFLKNVGVRVGLVQKLADYLGVNYTNIRVDEYGPGPYMTFHLDNVPYDQCTSPYIDKFGKDKISPDLKAALAPEYGVKDGSYVMKEPCNGIVGAVAATPNKARGVWWSPTLIPVIVLGILLLVLGLCLMFVLRRKHKQGLSADDRTTFIYKRKPVVFKEEYDVKEDLLKQPLVVPNEKPPLPPPAYPRTPNGSAVTTPMMGDERRAYQAPSFTSSRQMSSSASSNAMMASNGGAAMSSGGGGGGGGAAGGMAGGGGGGSGGGAAGAGGGGAGGGGAGGFGGGGAGGGGASMGGGGAGGGGGGAGGGGGGAGGGGAGAGGGEAGAGAGGGGSAMNVSKSSNYSYSSSSQSSSARKGAYSGYRLPPAYVPP